MTRINNINVAALTDAHLLAEYREIGRISALARPPKRCEGFPDMYTLGKGHVVFFYDKGGYLARRNTELYHECLVRGFRVTNHDYRLHPEGLNNAWEPVDRDYEINIGRLLEKFDTGTRYRYRGKMIGKQEYIEILKDHGYKFQVLEPKVKVEKEVVPYKHDEELEAKAQETLDQYWKNK